MKKKEIKPILLVDADKFKRNALNTVLLRNGYECIAIGSGFQAMKEIELKPMSIAIIVNNFEDMPGVELSSLIKSNHPNVPVIQIAEYPDEDEENMALAAGVDFYIPDYANKNFLLEIISKTI